MKRKIIYLIILLLIAVTAQTTAQEVLTHEKIETIITKYTFGTGNANDKKKAEELAIQDLKDILLEQLKNQVKVEEMVKNAKTGISNSKGSYEIIAYIEDGNLVTKAITQTTTSEPVKSPPAQEQEVQFVVAAKEQPANPETKVEPMHKTANNSNAEPETPTRRATANSVIDNLLLSENTENLKLQLADYSQQGKLTYTEKLHIIRNDVANRYIAVYQNNKIIALLSPYSQSRYDYVSKTSVSDIQQYLKNPENKFIYINILKNN